MDRLELKRRHLLGAGVAGLATAGLSACHSQELPGQVPEGSRAISVGASDEPQTLDITASAQAAIAQVLLYNVYETLVSIDAEGKLRPLLASAWTISDDRLTYRFTLHENARFASGTAVDADAVVSSLELIRGGTIKNKTLVNHMAVVESVTAEDPTTVVVKLSRPSLFWLYNLAGSAGVILDPAGRDSLADKPMGSGPYVVDSQERGTSLTLKRNANYWGTPLKIDTVTFRYFTDPNAMNAAMLSGDLDVISNVAAPQALSQFEDTSRFTILEGYTAGEVVLGMNHQNAALAKKQVRQAICHAVDRQALVNSVWGGKGQLIGSMVAPGDPWFEDLSQTYPFDPDKARELLKEAGHASGLTLRFRTPTLPYGPGVATFVASQLKDVGITVKVEELDFTRWLDEVYGKGQYDLTVVAHVEPRDIVAWSTKENYWHYDNAELRRLLEEADAADEQRSTELMKQAAKVLADDAAADFLWLLPNLVVTRNGITGISKNATTLSFDLTMAAMRSS